MTFCGWVSLVRFISWTVGVFLVLGSVLQAADTSPRPVLRPGSVPPPGYEELIKNLSLTGEAGFAAIDIETGQVLEQHNGNKGFAPASVTKAITALYALDTLGPDFRFETTLRAIGPIQNGVLNGDLILVGGGDPHLDTDDLANLVTQLTENGITQITGQFLFNGTALPTFNHIVAAQPVHVGYNPAISGLNLNSNRFYFEWKKRGANYAILLDARGRHINPKSTRATLTIQDQQDQVFTYSRNGNQEEWSVLRGALGKEGGRWLPTRKPALYAAEVFRELARMNGIDLPAPVRARTPAAGSVIGVHHSDPLSVIVKSMLRFSTNLSAEVLGLMASGERGSLSASAATMNTWAQTRLGLANATFQDHSGLSDRTRISPVSFARAMARAEQTFPEFQPLLKPIKSRQFNGTLDKTGRAQIAAKTGTLNFVSALGGYQISEGRKIAFAIFVQDFGKRAKVDLAKNDRPRSASNWAKRARRLHHGLLYRWARMEF
jgi:D-alanyl-D-alanine carboxypeptidase/D-alanyl-D-alanine-endopeptidase (penicillin-binding protein 4)